MDQIPKHKSAKTIKLLEETTGEIFYLNTEFGKDSLAMKLKSMSNKMKKQVK